MLRIAHACFASQTEKGNEEVEIEGLIKDISTGTIPPGGKQQYDARCRLIEYILEKRKVETPGCRICPACLSETPNCFSFCLQCHGLLISHGIRLIVFEIIDDETDEEEETKRQLEEQIKKEEEEPIFQETVNQAQREAEAESDSQYGFDPDEVDFSDEQEDEMETSEKGDDEAAMEVDGKDDEDRAEAGKTSLDKLPKWARNLDPPCKKILTSGLINCDADETAAQIIDNGIMIMANIILLYGHYCNNRVYRTPEGYHKDMVENQMGRMTLMASVHTLEKRRAGNSNSLKRAYCESTLTTEPPRSNGVAI